MALKRTTPVYGSNAFVAGATGERSLDDALSQLNSLTHYFLVASYSSQTSASAALNAINKGKRGTYVKGFAFTTSVDKKQGRSYLYARRDHLTDG